MEVGKAGEHMIAFISESRMVWTLEEVRPLALWSSDVVSLNDDLTHPFQH